ncbi:40S ribosomal protein S30 [Cladophialophora bantiana CBS 173.52]|uniref:40S ribosomal protein S30 n=1 Tax=Cladophialophora bantiana (strain ATCC 10958 / CBS 173.52 / CDC B-1940 / NIH 8579) TaxID=1442370 RepID=A0A0D2GEU3_CLAB1|nr:40S ribosomal protein S30 [Cladophialophora bantiana CBS 173.52]KIW96882.1 40S ribosomal protein S30 [Cladophialophora bantiana CBS 173.52]
MGKVHGSLARAGKVKSQTPKVEKQEKKKTPKGRAKKRITYTRRFVNVTMTGGKRKVWRLWTSKQGLREENETLMLDIYR